MKNKYLLSEPFPNHSATIQCDQWGIYQYLPLSKINKYPPNTDLFLQIAPKIPPCLWTGTGPFNHEQTQLYD